jgi:hypothetical protein
MIFAPGIDSLYLNGSSVHVARMGEYLVYGIATAVAEQAVPGSTREDFKLEQNYPNPFSAGGGSAYGGNPTTTIVYSVPARAATSSAFVQLRVFDILGREVALLVGMHHPAGTYRVQFNGGSLPSGVYYYALSAGSYSQIKPMILMR